MNLHVANCEFLNYRRYRDENYKLTQIMYKDVPHWLQHRPSGFISLTMRRLSKAKHIPISAVDRLDEGIFQVKDYIVDTSIPTCQCMDHRQNYFWCKHILCLLLHGHMEELPAHSLHHPLITADLDYLRSIDRSIKYNSQSSSSVEQHGVAGICLCITCAGAARFRVRPWSFH